MKNMSAHLHAADHNPPPLDIKKQAAQRVGVL
jgi:hypothetical protein